MDTKTAEEDPLAWWMFCQVEAHPEQYAGLDLDEAARKLVQAAAARPESDPYLTQEEMKASAEVALYAAMDCDLYP